MAIIEKIKEYERSQQRRRYEVGERYYDTENVTINDRKFEIAYHNPENRFAVKRYENIWKANNKVASAYYPILVDQKIDYVLSNPVVYEDITEQQKTEYYGNAFYKNLKEIARGSATKGLYWGFVYIEDNKLKTMPVKPEGFLPIFDEQKNLIKGYRFWEVEYMEAKKKKTKYLVQEWDDKSVKVYEIKDKTETILSERAHITEYMKYGSELVLTGQHSWGRVPFIPLFNNAKGRYDLQRVKGLIDVYDIVYSDFANNLEDFQDVYWVIKNYTGTNLEAFLEEVKDLKVLSVGADGDAKAHQVEIPHEARDKFLEITDRNIFKYGQGLDTDQLDGGSLTNVAIQAKYSNLDMKGRGFSDYVTEYIMAYSYFVSVFAATDVTPSVSYDYSILVNKNENLETNIKLKGDISDRTRWENNPLVKDVDEEFERKAQEQSAVMEMFGGGINANNEQ